MVKPDEMFFEIFGALNGLVKKTFQLIKRPRVVLIIPARNEEKNIARVIKAGKKSKYVTDILVVDSFSTDRTVRVAKEVGAKVIKQDPKKSGKGGAIYTGIKKASGEVLVFMDADIENVRADMIDKLVKPIIKGEADHVVAKFKRKMGRVTLLTAKPLLNLYFPEIKLLQHLSGLFAARAYILRQLEIEEGWGAEVSRVIDIAMKGYRTKEINIGYVAHDSKELKELTPMAEEVAKVILKKAVQYKRTRKKVKSLLLRKTKNNEGE